MFKRSYRILRWLCKTFSRRMHTEWTVPFDKEPCVFVVNHAGAWGPIDMCAKFELRDECRPWFNAAVMDPKEVPAYVRQDYWWKPGCALEPFFNATLPYIAAAVLPPILRSAPGVPVYHDARVMTTMRQSVRLLKEGRYIIIFPEQPSGWRSHHTWINTGFLQLAVLYFRSTGRNLNFWPVHIDRKERKILVGAPVAMDVSVPLEDQKEALSEKLAAGLRGEVMPAGR